MRIQEIHIDGYGIYHEFEFKDIPDGFSVILGENEAGKSTLLSFLRSILFGFQDKRSKENLYEPLRGGQKGGRLVVVPKSGERYLIERRGGTRGGEVKIMMPDGTEAGETALRHLIGSAGREVFQSVFAFSLTELQEISSLERDEVKEAIYSAGMGTGARRITDAQSQLVKKRDDIFKPAAKNADIPKLLGQIEQLKRDIQECEGEPERYAQLLEELSLRDSEIRALEIELKQNKRRLDHVRELQKGWEDWISMQQASSDLEDLDVVEEFPPDGVPRLVLMLEGRRSLQDQFDTVSQKLEGQETRRNSIAIDEKLIEQAEPIRDVERSRETFVSELQSLPALESDLERIGKLFETSARELGPGWDEGRVSSFDNSIAVRERVRSFQERLRVGEDSIKTARAKCDAAQDTLQELREQEKNELQALDALPPPANTFDEDSIRKLQLRFEQYSQADRDFPVRKSDLDAKVHQLRASLQEIGPDWDEDKLQSFNASLAAREEIRTHLKTLTDTSRKVEELEKLEFSEQAALKKNTSELQEAELQLQDSGRDRLTEASLDQKRHSLRSMRSRFAEREKLSEKIAQLQERKVDLELPSGGAGGGKELIVIPALGIIACLLIGLTKDDWVTGGLVMAGTFALFVVLKSRSSSPDSVGAHARFAQIEEKLAESLRFMSDQKEEMTKFAAELGLVGEIDAASIEHAEKKLAELGDRLGQIKLERARLEEMARAVTEARSEVDRTSAGLEAARKEEEQARNGWTSWLKNFGLSQSLSPEKALDIFSGLAATREKLHGINDLRVRIETIGKTIRSYREDLQQCSEALGGGEVTDDNIPEIFRHLVSMSEKQSEMAENWQAAQGKIKETQKLLAKRLTDAGQAGEKLKTAEQKQAELTGEWKEELGRLGLPETLAIEGSHEFFERLESCRSLLVSLGEKRARLVQAKAFILKFQTRVSATAEAVGRQVPTLENVSVFSSTLSEDLIGALEDSRGLQALMETVGELQADSRRLTKELDAREQEISDLLKEAGTTDEEEFRRKGETFAIRARLKLAIKQHDSRLEKQTGTGDAHASFKKELSQATPEALKEESRTVEEIVNSAEDDLGELNRVVGRLQAELKGLESSVEASQLRMQREALKAELNSKAHEWSVLQLASWLIVKAREKHERERRPAVLKVAERFFKKYTGGRYIELNAPIGESRVRVIRNDQKVLNVNDLSRGTAEQLYLALRFGFIQEYANKSEPLPLIFDDILVNFDQTRSKAAVEAILELAQSHQILLFTCHPETIDRVHAVNDSVPVWKLADGRIER